MENTNKRPLFTLHIEAPDKHFSWCIAKDGKVIHHIDNINKFSKEIGYPDVNPSMINVNGEITSSVISADHHDFISNPCTQSKITAYLIKHCENSRLELAGYYAEVVELCKKHLSANTEECSGCMMQSY